MRNDLYANLIMDINASSLDKPFLYHIDETLSQTLKVGDKVLVPFGKSDNKEGYVIYIGQREDIKQLFTDPYYQNDNNYDEAKDIKEILTSKISISNLLIDIAVYMSKKYYTSLITCLKTVLPVKEVVRGNKRQKDIVENVEKANKNIYKLNEEQEKVANDLIKYYKENKFSDHLLFGITGSGKTEVYIKLIEEVLKSKKKVILLIPEISLTYQTVSRIKEKFDNVAVLNSHMSKGEKYIQIKKCLENKIDILIGARSAVFAPLDNLGLIIIDEEDDASYKSDKNPRYNTYDIAKFRCIKQGAMLLSLSATPCVSHYFQTKNNKIILHKLTKKAVNNAKIVDVNFVDMRKELKQENRSMISNKLYSYISDKLKKNEQVMLYMNRRGFSKAVVCLDCGYKLKCPHCDIALTLHQDNTCKCHYCGYEITKPLECPNCHSKRIKNFGAGTQQLEKVVKEKFKEARVIRMDRDTVSKKDAYDNIIKQFKNKEADILIGTQMIVKGHDFDDVTLVAVMCADMNLNIESYKATEEAFSLFTQVIGRSGRKKAGDCIIQTYEPENIVFDTLINCDYEKFYENEIAFRKEFEYPPFVKLLIINIKSKLEDELEEATKDLRLYLDSKVKNAIVYGPSKPYPSKVKDFHYRIFYLKIKTIEEAMDIRINIDKFIRKLDSKNILNIQYDIEE